MGELYLRKNGSPSLGTILHELHGRCVRKSIHNEKERAKSLYLDILHHLILIRFFYIYIYIYIKPAAVWHTSKLCVWFCLSTNCEAGSLHLNSYRSQVCKSQIGFFEAVFKQRIYARQLLQIKNKTEWNDLKKQDYFSPAVLVFHLKKIERYQSTI